MYHQLFNRLQNRPPYPGGQHRRNDGQHRRILQERLLHLISAQEKVTFNWVKGHDGHPENERCDELAMSALNSNNLLADVGYEPKISQNDDDEGLGFSGSFKNAKVKKEGDLCKKCSTKVIKRNPQKKTAKQGQAYYFEYYLFCPSCKTMYMVEDAKREIDNQGDNLFT